MNTDLESLEIDNFLCKFWPNLRNNQTLLNKISLQFLDTTKLFTYFRRKLLLLNLVRTKQTFLASVSFALVYYLQECLAQPSLLSPILKSSCSKWPSFNIMILKLRP
jgi:hypothetical protein